MQAILHPTYFPNVAHVVAMVKSDMFIFEIHDNYQKQTYRNRTYIYGANGKLLLNIPIKHSQKNRQLYKNVKIENATNWQDLHWKSLQSAYRTSPFFEFYEDAIQHVFQNKFTFLLDYNIKCLQAIFDCLQLPFDYQYTTVFEKVTGNKNDFRYLVNCKKEIPQQFTSYTQVFGSKHGFLQNLSILDLLFNEGPNAINYLMSQQLSS